MTTTRLRETPPAPTGDSPTPQVNEATPVEATPVAAEPARATTGSRRRPVAALMILSGLLLGFGANLAVVGQVRHQRDQRIAFDEFRAELAKGTAPVAQTDRNGKLLKLGTPVALLSVPSLGLTEVVREGTTSGVLRSGPGHRRDSVLPGQLGVSVVYGRQAAYGGPFRRIGQLRAGDKITVITGQKTHEFQVVGPRRAGDAVPALSESSRGRLTLVTGDGPAFMPSGVLRVDADLVSNAKLTPARAFSAADLPLSERPMRGDSSALFLVVLWGQAFVVAALAVAFMLRRWGRWQGWIVGVPVLAALGCALGDQTARLLPNLL